MGKKAEAAGMQEAEATAAAPTAAEATVAAVPALAATDKVTVVAVRAAIRASLAPCDAARQPCHIDT